MTGERYPKLAKAMDEGRVGKGDNLPDPAKRTVRSEEDDEFVYTTERVQPHSLCCDKCKQAEATLRDIGGERAVEREKLLRLASRLERNPKAYDQMWIAHRIHDALLEGGPDA